MKIIAMSKEDFDLKMLYLGLNDSNVEETKHDYVFISINPSMIDEADMYGDNVQPHFKHDHANVLRLFYDDVVQDIPAVSKITGKPFVYKAMNTMQGEQVVEFLKKSIYLHTKTVYVHCTMGKSRSVATAQFIAEFCSMLKDVTVEAREDATPNPQVLGMLRSMYRDCNV
jgi:predicted protein tyrosine phosphatase